jgi:hypothetical protein
MGNGFRNIFSRNPAGALVFGCLACGTDFGAELSARSEDGPEDVWLVVSRSMLFLALQCRAHVNDLRSYGIEKKTVA